MTFSSCLSEADHRLVLDASVLINVLATGHSIGVLEALRRPVVVPDVVIREIEDGERPDRRQLQLLDGLIRGQVIEVATLGDDALGIFAGLVSGHASESLGDGEAATIALAVMGNASAVIDEKKATKLCATRYPDLRMASTVDLLGHDAVEVAIGRTTLATATLAALTGARMQVRSHQFDWVAALIGPEGVAQCSSLRRLAKARHSTEPFRAVG